MTPRTARPDDRGPTLSVVICAYTLDRWEDLSAAVASVRAQRRPPDELLLVVDHCPALAERAARQLPGVQVIANSLQRGLSGARNTGVAAATGEVVAFLDDDAVADPQWTLRLLAGYRDPAVLGVGGLVRAWWESGRPEWFPPEFDWVVGCSYHGSPRAPARVRNFTGANMSFRRADVLEAGGFRVDLGRVGTKPLGCEETELCLRIAARHPHAELRFEPAAVVRHHVPPTRTTWSYFSSRCYAEGRSKAMVARHAGPRAALSDERRYLRRTVPAAIVRSVLHARFRTAGTLCAGVGITVLGYTSGRAGSLLAGAAGGATGTAEPAAERRSPRSPR
ncbi:glycosyltransferase family 2 protein [Kitasatospora sp. NPDC094015]|uniref:glycosyltransferase family 2 protein n=1 Tax=Kitasatospora sp. NPDC094015 TaxID=3155205 RepID=UPI00333158DD